MESFQKKIEVRWSDLDPNFHMLHSKYYDLGAYCRIALFVDHGLTPSFMSANTIGPILFREECIFKREITFGDDVSINVKLSKSTPDFSRWSMIHEIWKNGNILAALIHIDAAWIDTQKRKLRRAPAEVAAVFEAFPKTPDFSFYSK